MTIFNTAYDTIGSPNGDRLKDTREKLQAGAITNSFHEVNIELGNYEKKYKLELVTGGNSTSDMVPYFAHPIFHTDENKQNVCFIDVRNFGKWYAPQAKFIVRNSPEFNWNCLRGILNHIWLDGRHNALKEVSKLPLATYAALISEAVSRRYALDPGEQAIISVVAAYFYYSLFTNEIEFSEEEYNKIVGVIAKVTRVPATKVYSVLDGLKTISGLEQLCSVIKEKTQSIRLEDFNVGVLISIVASNWFGSNAKENLTVALEHPPTWLMICYASITEASFKKSVLAKLVERFSKNNDGENFLKSMNSILSIKETMQALDFNQ